MDRIISLLFFLLISFIVSPFVNAQVYPQRTIEEVQFVLNPDNDDQSFLLGDTIEVRGLVMNNVRDLAVNDGWACFILDVDFPQDPWQGLQIVQIDTSVAATQFGNIQSGMICRFTGVVEESETMTQLSLLSDPLVPVVIESAGHFLPAPIPLGTADLTNRENGEQWEGQLVRIETAMITDNNFSSNRAVIEDISGMPTFADDGFAFFNNRFGNGSYNWPPNGTEISIAGFVRSLIDGNSINPRDFADLTTNINAPQISEVQRSIVVPTSTDMLMISAVITDNSSVASAALHYSIDDGEWTTTAMTGAANLWEGEIPPQADGSFLRYFVSAIDDDGFTASFPADTSRASGNVFRYIVRDDGLRIADVQNTYGYNNDVSGYVGYTVELQGVVMSQPTHFSGYFIQDAAAAWSGIFATGTLNIYEIGDLITISGMIEEDFGLTKMDIVSSELETAGVGAFMPVPHLTGDLTTGGPLAEAFESVLVSFENVTVTEDLPDSANNFGEFIIDDGSGGLRVDDLSELYEGNLGGEIIQGSVGNIQGIHYYQFSEFKLEPRDSSDVSLAVVGINDKNNLSTNFTLAANYPNPFNPSTTIRYQIATAGFTQVIIYNVRGEKVRTLVASEQPPGQYSVTWNGRSERGKIAASGIYFYSLKSGNQQQVRQMLLIR